MMDPFFRHFFGPGQEQDDQKERGLGSGVIVSADGIVLTNNHVVAKADEIKVATADNREFDVEVVGTDEKSDLAVLRLKGDISGLVPVKFADSNRLRLGDVVLAIGNPFGVGESVTMGIVSAKGRANMGIIDYEDLIQTDAAINPGNSGGALINMEGELVGINTAILSRSGGSMGIGFAIPSNMAKPISQSLLEKGKVIRGWLGIGIQDIDSDLAKALNLENTAGVLVTEVMNGGPASKAGLERGDVIVSINGEKVDSTGRLRNLVAAAGATQAKVAILRQGKKSELNVALGEQPMEKVASGKATPSNALDGLNLEMLSDANRSKLGIDASIKSGIVVVGVAPGSSAADSGLRQGDVILEINHHPVTSLEGFRAAYQKASGRSLLVINRGGSTLFLVLKKG
jgi:serine protease Do